MANDLETHLDDIGFPPPATGDEVERVNRVWRHFYNTTENPPENLVRKLIAALSSERDALTGETDDELTKQLLRDADEIEACGGGNEAANIRKMVTRLREYRAKVEASNV